MASNVVNFNCDFAKPSTAVRLPIESSKKRRYLVYILLAGFFAFLLRTFIFTTAAVTTESMSPTLKAGDVVLVSLLSYVGSERPKKGDIVLLRFPSGPFQGEVLLRRVVALPQDVVSESKGRILINGEAMPGADYATMTTASAGSKEAEKITSLGAESYFVLSDFASSGKDSREFGPVPASYIVGRAVFIYWSWQQEDSWPMPSFERMGRVLR